MFSLLEQLQEWIKEALIGGIMGNFEGVFNSVNSQVSDIAVQVGTTPAGWNAGVFSMIQSLSNTVILPIAGIILTFVVCYELIQMIISSNNMHDFDTFLIFKWIFKTYIAVFLLTNTFNIAMAVFDVAQHVISGSSGIISGSLNADVAIDALQTMLEGMEWYELLGLYLESFVIGFCMKVLSVCIFIIAYGRMLEIYITVSVAPIPFATMVPMTTGRKNPSSNGWRKLSQNTLGVLSQLMGTSRLSAGCFEGGWLWIRKMNKLRAKLRSQIPQSMSK